ncbi:MAG TPA: hypothetical protein P5145_04350 [Tenuifilaceae bacterium]|nr:hypothetical protein [Tenuifilaceae bacterium]
MDYLKNAKARIDEANELIGRAIGLEKLSTIERDIILDKLAKAYDCLLTGQLVSVEIKHTEPVKSVAKNIEPVVERQQPKIDTVIAVESEKIAKPTISEKKEEVVVEKPKPEPQKPSVIPSAKLEETLKPEQTDHAQGEILAEKFQGKQKFRNEIIAEHTTKLDMSTKLQNKPIGDLTKAIGINDKFLFIKELFNGDSARYSETISHLNSFADLNDAIIYLQDNFEWAESNEYAAKFIDLVRRKFI